MKLKSLLALIVFILCPQILLSEGSEEQTITEEQKLLEIKKLDELEKLDEMKKFAEFQKFLEMQKFMEMQKMSEVQKLSEMQKSSQLENSPEMQEFLNNGYGINHYKLAQRLNLDLENYKIFRANKTKRIKGRILTATGAGFTLAGGLFILCGIMLDEALDYYDDHYYDYDDDYDYDDYDYNDDFIKNFYIGTGSIMTASGLGLLISGVIINKKIEDVIRKDGKKLSLKPKLDIKHNTYGAEFSYSF